MTNNISLKQFVLASGAEFKSGRGFYQLNKKENVSAKKEIILQNTLTGEFFTGESAKRLVGLNGAGSVSPADIPEGYLAFVQSKSHSRKLTNGSMFLYEIS